MPRARRIAIAGFQHETNTFAPGPATYEEFEKQDAWPGLCRGEALLENVAGLNLPVAGFVESALHQGQQVLPILWCSAEPSSYVTSEAFESISGEICAGLRAVGRVDGVYLDLHGAMVTEAFQDAEGELLRRVRGVVGGAIPIVVSLDFHANITADMARLATAMTVYRTYPHLDMASTGARAWRLLGGALSGERVLCALRKLPFLIPLPAQCTDLEPCRSLYRRLPTLSSERVLSVDFAAGFPHSDIKECGPAVVAYGTEASAVEASADGMLRAVMAAEPQFSTEMLPADEAVRRAMALNSAAPVILADAQDNPGAGSTSDTVGILEALVRQRARGAVMAIVHDPDIARLAGDVGVGAQFDAALGGKYAEMGQGPFAGRFRVEALGNGRFTCSGAMYRGTRTELGPMALLRVQEAGIDVRVIVGSERFQCLDQAIFRHLGVEPAQQKILVVKSTVHFRDDFEAIADQILVVESPGANPCRLTVLPYKHLRDGVRLEPGSSVSLS